MEKSKFISLIRMALARVFHIYSDKKFILLDDIKFVAEKKLTCGYFYTRLTFHETTGALCGRKSTKPTVVSVYPRGFWPKAARKCEQSITSGFALELLAPTP